MTNPQGSVTKLIADAKQGCSTAFEQLWGRYHDKVVEMARQRMGTHPKKASDEHDVAQSALCDFWNGLTAGQFTQLTNRNDLDALLFTITSRKVVNHIQREHRQKRSQERTEEGYDCVGSLISRDLSPQMALIGQEEYERMLQLLNDEQLRQIAVWKMEDMTAVEIAQRLGCSKRLVFMKLDLIRKIWERELKP